MRYRLFLDESGKFEDDRNNPNGEISFVGGILAAETAKIKAVANGLCSNHATERYDKNNIKNLEMLTSAGNHLCIFENKEKIQVLNSDITYLNVLS